MRPKLITPQRILLFFIACAVAGGLFFWLSKGAKIGVGEVPSTAGKLLFVSDRNAGQADLFMMDGTDGSNAVVLTEDGKGRDTEPAWSNNGEQIAFTSDRYGEIRQLYMMAAIPNSSIATRTNSSSTKELPQFGPADFVYYLDAGRITSISPNNPTTDAIFPTAEQKRDLLAAVFAAGGIKRFNISPDGERIAAVIGLEQGEMAVLYFPKEKGLLCLGVAREIRFSFLADGTLVTALFGGNLPMIIDPNDANPNPDERRQIPGILPFILPQMLENPGYKVSESMMPVYNETRSNLLFAFTPEGQLKMLGSVPEEMNATGFALSPEGGNAAITSDEGKLKGLYILQLDGQGNASKVSDLPAREPIFAPDGEKLAFVSGKDIYVVTAGGEPVNLTKGQGTNFNPVWSPAKAPAK